MSRRGNCGAENPHDLSNVPSSWLQFRLAGSNASTHSTTPCICRIMIFLVFSTTQERERFSCKKASCLQRSLGIIPQVCGSEVDWLHYVTSLIHKESYPMFCFPLSQLTWQAERQKKKIDKKCLTPTCLQNFPIFDLYNLNNCPHCEVIKYNDLFKKISLRRYPNAKQPLLIAVFGVRQSLNP